MRSSGFGFFWVGQHSAVSPSGHSLLDNKVFCAQMSVPKYN